MEKKRAKHPQVKKKYGQNFLNNIHIIKKIVHKLDITDSTGVIEIGPGKGALTKEILNRTDKVLLIEIDKDMINFLLNNKIITYDTTTLNEDVLDLDFNELINLYFHNVSEVVVVSNMPYYITSPIIFKLLNLEGTKLTSFTLMMQKEVAERIIAQPNTKQYNNLSIACQYLCTIEEVVKVNRNNFFPVPKVDSTVLKFTFNKKDNEIIDSMQFISFVRKMFSFKRKTILNNLSNVINLDKDNTSKILVQLNLDTNLRPENLSIDDYQMLYKLLVNEGYA